MSRYDLQENEKPRYFMLIMLAAVVAIIGLFFLLQTDDENQVLSQTETPINLPEQPPEIEPPISTRVYDGETPWNSQTNTENALHADAQTQIDEPIATEEVSQLPALADSDPIFRKDMLNLSEGLETWLATNQLIRKNLVLINDFSQGLRIHKHMKYFAPDEPFKVARDRHGLYMDPAGYHRYDKLATAINAMNVSVAVMLYNKYQPLLLEVFAEFGYPEGYQLDDLFRKSAAEILEAPVIHDRISLYRPSVRYKFSSPKLENLSPVQKQMIRMGPENTKIIQQKVRLLIEALINQSQSGAVTLG